MFRTVPLSIIRSFSLYTQQCHTGLLTRLRAGSCSQAEKLLMMDRGTVRNVYNFIPKMNLRNYCI